VFPTKLLGIAPSQLINAAGNTVFVAEAGGTVSAVDLTSSQVSRIGQGVSVPITCLTSYSGRESTTSDANTQSVFAGSWDKNITRFSWNQDPATTIPKSSQRSFKAHNDFVKCLLVAPTPDKQTVLISGGADGDVNIWTVEGKRFASIKPQSRGIEHLALDPLSSHEAPRVFFSTSQREIYSFELPPINTPHTGSIKISAPIIQHETSVYKLEFDNDGDLWTASADKTAKRLVRENNFVADTTLTHPDFVRDIVIFEPASLAITACRDEEVRVWNSGTSQLLHIFSGHFDEVTGLAVIGNMVISVSIDATLRKWSLAPTDLKKAIEESKTPKLLEQVPEPQNDFDGLTEEEEAALRALMEDEEAEALEKMAEGEQ